MQSEKHVVERTLRHWEKGTNMNGVVLFVNFDENEKEGNELNRSEEGRNNWLYRRRGRVALIRLLGLGVMWQKNNERTRVRIFIDLKQASQCQLYWFPCPACNHSPTLTGRKNYWVYAVFRIQIRVHILRLTLPFRGYFNRTQLKIFHVSQLIFLILCFANNLLKFITV